MANRRMFSMDIVESDEFLEMPASSRDLYFHLGMRADDVGFINPKQVMKLTGASVDDLKVLIAKRFLLPFEDGVVVVKHWLIHNTITKDRFKETRYLEHKSKLFLKENKSYTFDAEQGKPLMGVRELKKLTEGGIENDLEPDGNQDGTEMVPNQNQDGTKMVPQVRLGKDSIDIRGDLFGTTSTKLVSKTKPPKTDNSDDGTDTKKKNSETLKGLIAKGEFEKKEYAIEPGVFDWRYLIFNGKYLNGSKYMVAMFWKLKQGYEKLQDQYGFNYNFKTKDKAIAVLNRDMKFGKELASTIEFKELAKLVEIVDDMAWSDKDKRYQYEWQLSTLLKNVQRLDG